MNTSKVAFLAIVCLLLTSGKLHFGSSVNLSGQSQEEYLPVVNELPDIFLRNDGSRVTTVGQWKSHREELIEKLLKYEYGHLAQSSPVHVINESADSIIRDGTDIIKKRVVNLKTGPGGEISFTLNLFVPDKSEGPFPAIIDGDLCWGSLLKRLKPEGLISLVKRGYIIVEFDRTIFAADRNTRDEGVFPLYPNYDWGALAAWAWGFHRTIDYLLTQSEINKDKICVTGWSRGGKACLLAVHLMRELPWSHPTVPVHAVLVHCVMSTPVVKKLIILPSHSLTGSIPLFESLLEKRSKHCLLISIV